jgi:chemotaxis receptor (MCP) glutamine deamidase CheD
MFPDSKGEDTTTPGKYADLGVPILIRKVIKAGADRSKLEVYLVGGNYLSELEAKGKPTFDVGKSNLIAVRKVLKKENLNYKEFDTQQNTGTIAIFDVTTGDLKVKYLEKIQRSDAVYKETKLIGDSTFNDLIRSNVRKGLQSLDKKMNPVWSGSNHIFDSAISVNIYGQIKGKIILFINKKFAYSLFTYNIISKEPPPDNDYTPVLKMTSDKFLKPIIKDLSELFRKNELRVKFTEPSVFSLSKYIKLNFDYPERWESLFQLNGEAVKIALSLGKIK